MTKNVALITGASSGIGLEFAKIHAQAGGDLVLVARRKEVLEKLKQELEQQHNVQVLVVAADLSDPNSANEVFEATEKAGVQVEILINNAGFGGHGKFFERDLKKDQDMIQVNVTTLVNLTHLYLKGMVARNSGRILHVSSTAGFLPGPLQAVYYGTKAFVNSFSQAIAEELRGTNVTSTVLCPGAVKTGFVKAGDLEGVDAWDKAATPESVAKCGYEAMMKGKLLTINERALDFMLHWVVPFLPRKRVLKMSRDYLEKS